MGVQILPLNVVYLNPALAKGEFNSLPNDKILDWSKIKALADDKINVVQKLKFCVWEGRKHCGKRRKCW